MTPNILYTDPHMLVAVKPAGMLSEGESADSFPRALSHYYASLEQPSLIFPVHRLDRETEGLMVYARTQKAAAALSKAITDGSFQKEYLALLHGIPEKASDTLTDLLFYDRQRGKSYVVSRDRKGVKKAVLTYSLLRAKQDRALVRIQPQTGRTHQIRVQFASRGMPLLGDRKYGAPITQPTLALYSHTLRFPHPISGEPLTFSSLPDPSLSTVWQDWELCRKASQ